MFSGFGLFCKTTPSIQHTNENLHEVPGYKDQKSKSIFERFFSSFTVCFGHSKKSRLQEGVTLAPPNYNPSIDILSEIFINEFPQIKGPTSMVMGKSPSYTSISRGLEELRTFCKEAIEEEDVFKEEQIPKFGDLKSLYDRFVAAKNESGNRASLVSDKSGWIVKIKDKNYLIFPQLSIGKGGTADGIVAGIDLETGECVAARKKTYNPEDPDDLGAISNDIYCRVFKLQEDEEGGILPLKGMVNIEVENEPKKKVQILITKLCHHGTISDHLRSDDPFSFKEKLKIGQDGFKALLALHAEGLLHGDLLLENFLIDGKKGSDEFKVYLGDFDRTIDMNSVLKRQGRFSFLPPEVILRGLKEYKAKAEVWAYGIILYSLFTGDEPYIVKKLAQKRINEKDYKYEHTDFSFAVPSWASIKTEEQSKLSLLLSKMMNPLINRRCSMEEASRLFDDMVADFEKSGKEIIFNPPSSREEENAKTVNGDA